MQYDFSIQAGGGVDIQATGSYIKYLSGLGKIRVRVSSGGYIDLIPGQGIRVAKEFGSLNVSDRSGNANFGVVLAGPFEFSDDTINGVVSIVDGGKNSTLSKNCFLGTVDSGNLAANFNGGFLINPAASGKNVVVESVWASVSASAWLSMFMLAVAPSSSGKGQNKYAAVGGGVQSAAIVEPNYANSLGFFGTSFSRQSVTTSAPLVRKYAEPLIIPPGVAIVVVNNTQGANVLVDYEWREDPV